MDNDRLQGLMAQGGSADSTNVPPSTQRDRLSRPRKQLRTSRACDFCHNRSIRCRKSPGASRCQNCNDFDVTCRYDRPVKRRGIQSRRHATQELSSGEEANLLLQLTNGPVNGHQQPQLAVREPSRMDNGGNLENVIPFPLATEHRDLALGEAGMIADLVDVYFEVVYPM
jgi:hypothetical protein